MEELWQLLPLVGIVLLFWLFIVRPASRRQRTTTQMQHALEVGDEVVLTSGVYGTITELTETRVHLEVAPGTTIQVARGAIGGIAPPDDTDDTDDTEDTEDTVSARAETEEG